MLSMPLYAVENRCTRKFVLRKQAAHFVVNPPICLISFAQAWSKHAMFTPHTYIDSHSEELPIRLCITRRNIKTK